MANRVILVTGVAGYWGSRVAARLLSEPRYHVIGLDTEPPAEEIKRLDFVQADIHSELLAEFLQVESVDTVCHLAFVETGRPRESTFELNVMGTTRVLGACAQAGVRKAVIKSSMAVYGARPSNPAFLTEEHNPRGSRRWGTVRDLVEIETFCHSFGHQHPDIALTILRFPSIIGPTADTPMIRFLLEPAAPSLLGFDPMMQLIHEDDVVEALVHAVNNNASGAFNVAAEDVMPLNKMRGLAGKSPVAVLHMFAYWGARALGGTNLPTDEYLPIEPDYIRYSWVGDLSRMRQVLGFAPRYTAEETLREFADQFRTGPRAGKSMGPAGDDEQFRRLIEQRRRARSSKRRSHPVWRR